MRTALPVLAAAAGLALTGLARADFMLCFHQDGQVVLETFQERCCVTEDACCPESAPPACPDDQCHDLPLTLGAEDVLDASAPLFPSAAPLTLPIESELPAPAAPLSRPTLSAASLDPPDPLALLRSVVLRH